MAEWAPATYNPTNLVQVEKAVDPDDEKFELLKKLAIIFLWISFVMTLAIIAVEIFYICEEFIENCTYYGPVDTTFNKGTVILFVGLDILGGLFMAGIFVYVSVLYQKHHYENVYLLYTQIFNLLQLLVYFLVWVITSAAQAFSKKGTNCPTFAITCLILLPISMVIHILTIVFLFMFRRRVTALNPDLLHGGGPEFVPAATFTGISQPAPPPQYPPPGYQAQPPPA